MNLENDIVGKYIEKLMHFDEQVEEDTKTTGISMDFLAKNGFA